MNTPTELFDAAIAALNLDDWAGLSSRPADPEMKL